MTTTRTEPRYLCAWGDFEKEVIANLYRHRLLTTTQIHHLLKPDSQRRWVQRQLKRLEDGGYITRATGRPPGREARWICTSLGYTLAESSRDVELSDFRMDVDKARGPLADHLLATNDVGISLVETARESGDDFGATGWEHEIAHQYGLNKKERLIADAVLTYSTVQNGGVTAECRFIELDRGTTKVLKLVEKMIAYSHYFFWEPKKTDATAHLPRRDWKRRYVAFPSVVFVFAGLTANQAKVRTENFSGFLSADPRVSDKVEAVAITMDALRRSGPYAPVGIDVRTGNPAPLFG